MTDERPHQHATAARSYEKRAIVAIVLLTSIALGVAYRLTRPEEGFIVGIVPISDDESFVLMRANYDERASRGWLVRKRKDGSTAWATELPAPPDATGSGHGLASNGDYVVVLAGDLVSATQVVALDAKTGRIAWRRAQSGRSSAHPFIRPGEVVFTFDGPHGPVVFGLSLRDGRRLWTHRPASDIGVAIVNEHATRFAYRDAGWRVVALDAAGEHREAMRVEISGDACLDGDVLSMLDRDELVRVDVSGAAPRIERLPLVPSDGSITIADTCGRYGDDLAFFGRSFSQGAFRDAHVLLVGRDGRVRRRIDLGIGELLELGGKPDKELPAHHPLRGTLSPFVPFLLYRNNLRTELVVLDLARGALAWSSTAQQSLLHSQVVRGRDHVHYLTRSGQVLAVDGTNGRVLSAITSSMDGTRGFYATEHVLWGFSSDWSDMDTLPFATLDARTLALRTEGNRAHPRQEDVLARMISWLAVPGPYRARE